MRSAGNLHCEVIIFPFIINKYLVGKHSETMWILCYSSFFCPLILASVAVSCLKQLLLWCLPNGDFLFPSSLLHLSFEALFFLIPLFIQLFIYITRDLGIHILFCVLLPLCPPSFLPRSLPCLSVPASCSPSFLSPLFILLEKPGSLSQRVSLHRLWPSMSLWCHLTLSSIACVSCELAVAPEAWSDTGSIFLARPHHGWQRALSSGGTWGLAVSLSLTSRLISGFRSCQPNPSIVKFPISSSSTGFHAHW